MADFDEIKESVGELLRQMVEIIDERKWPFVSQASMEIERSHIGGIVEFPGLEIKSRGLRRSSPEKELQLKKELHHLIRPLSNSAKDIGLPPIYGAKITVKSGNTVSARLLFGGDELTADQKETVDKLLENWARLDSDSDCPTPHIERIAGHENIIQKSNDLLDCLLDIARSRKQGLAKVVYASAKQFVTLKGDPLVMLYGWNIRCGTDGESEALRIKVEAKMDALKKALSDAGLPELRSAEMQFWPRKDDISTEMSFAPGASREEEAVLQDLKRQWFKHLQKLHETDGEYCPGCGKTKCRN